MDISVLDSLVYHELAYKTLLKDTIEYKSQIRDKDARIALYRANEYDLKEQNKSQKNLADNYKASAIQFSDKYSKAQDKVNRRGKIIIGSVSVNILLILVEGLNLYLHK